MVMKAPGLTLVRGTQYWITKDAAVKLFGVTMMYWNFVSEDFDVEYGTENKESRASAMRFNGHPFFPN